MGGGTSFGLDPPGGPSELGSALAVMRSERSAHVQALVDAWASVAQWVPATTLRGRAGGDGASHGARGPGMPA